MPAFRQGWGRIHIMTMRGDGPAPEGRSVRTLLLMEPEPAKLVSTPANGGRLGPSFRADYASQTQNMGRNEPSRFPDPKSAPVASFLAGAASGFAGDHFNARIANDRQFTQIRGGPKMRTARLKGIKWLSDVQKHDYPAAVSCLGLLYGKKRVGEMVTGLRSAPIVQFKAKDIFRASWLSLLGAGNSEAGKDRMKIRRGQGLSPVLLVRDERNGRVVIADGYDRLCAVCGFDEDALIQCEII
jgi:hypothetical protein